MKVLARIVILGLLLLLLLVLAANLLILQAARGHLVDEVQDLPAAQVALVLGAYADKDHLSDILRDRVEAGILLRRQGKVRKLLLSGDHGQRRYDETNAMKHYVLRKAPDLPQEDVFLDHAGFDTYDSVVRAKKVFQADSVIMVTQRFHVARAVYLARSQGLVAVGLGLDEGAYSRRERLAWEVREILARVKAVGDVLLGSKPTFLGPPIPITGDGRASWD